MFEVETDLQVEFEGTRFAGAVVTLRLDMPVLEAMAITEELSTKTMAEQAPVFAERLLKGWNLQYQGKAIPATPEGAEQAPGALLRMCIEQWFKAVLDPKVPLSSRPPST